MEISQGNFINLNQRMCICIALIVSIMMVVSGERSTDKGYDRGEDVARSDFKTLWDIYILPRLELDLNQKASQWIDQLTSPETTNYNFLKEQSSTDQDEQRPSRYKRLGMAGLENLDIMTKTLDRNRLPMSVNMNSNKLRMLMRTVGRRRK